MAELEPIEVVFEGCILRVAEAPGADGRTLIGYMVPWDKPAEVVRPTKGFEVYRRGALTRTLNNRKSPVPLLGLHSEGEPLGILTDHEADGFGERGVFRLFDTQRSRDAAELVREGLWTGLSIGGFGVPSKTKVTSDESGVRTIERSEIVLDHVGLVRQPAFDEARVLALRHVEQADAEVAAEAAGQGPPVDIAAQVELRRQRRAALVGVTGDDAA